MPKGAPGAPRDCYFLHSVGRRRVRCGLRQYRLAWVAVVIAVLAAPATTAAASPAAVDQYTTHLPGAGGNPGLASGSAPVAQPGVLLARTRAALTGPDGQLLALIATAPGLGAPAVRGGRVAAVNAPSGGSRPLTTAFADAAGSGPGLALLGVLAGIVLLQPGLATSVVVDRRSDA